MTKWILKPNQNQLYDPKPKTEINYSCSRNSLQFSGLFQLLHTLTWATYLKEWHLLSNDNELWIVRQSCKCQKRRQFAGSCLVKAVLCTHANVLFVNNATVTNFVYYFSVFIGSTLWFDLLLMTFAVDSPYNVHVQSVIWQSTFLFCFWWLPWLHY